MRLIVSLLACLLVAAALRAQEVRTAPEGHTPPPATVADLGWLTGIWTGEGIGGAPAIEVYSPPGGGSVAGHFAQEDGEGGIAFFELMQITEADGSLVYRLKHFDDALAGWEEKDEYVSFPLVAVDTNALYFDGLTLRRAGDTLISAVNVRQSDGTVEEYVFRYSRAGDAPLCPDAATTLEINECFGARDGRAEERMRVYLAAALERYAESPEVARGIEAAQTAFVAYRDQECGAVYEDWKDGTMRAMMELGCRTRLTDQRTLALWRNWLTYMDTSPPVLPEPQPTR